MRAFHSVSLADQVFERLEDDIIFGVYPRGEVLTEMKLVEQLGVSRTPIREALRRLEQERLIADSGKGSVVLGITQEDFVDIMSIRQLLEGLAAKHTAENVTEEAGRELLHILDLQDFYAAKWDTEHLRQVDDEFHDAVARFCLHPVIYDTLQPLLRKTRRYRRAALEDREKTLGSMKEHREIYEAIMQGNGNAAMQLMSAHVEKARILMIGSEQSHG